MNSIKLHYATISKSAYKTSFNAQKIILKKDNANFSISAY